MPNAIRIASVGGPEVMGLEEITSRKPESGEIRIRVTAIGVNFIDVYFRTGLYNSPLPFTAGKEAAGIVEEVGAGVTEFSPGDRVASASLNGAYATEITAPAAIFVKVPDAISDETAAAMMLKGMTACYLLRRTYRVEKGHTVLVHAASGGVGSILTQWASHLGATVIGTVGSTEKADIAKNNGCAHTILYRNEDFVARVAEITGGRKCDVVYDSVGRMTFLGSLDCLRPLGMLVLFGQSSGPIQNFDPILLSQKGSLFMTRPTLFHYTATRESLKETARELFDVVASGAVEIEIGQRFALNDAAQAHRALESRGTRGSTVLLP